FYSNTDFAIDTIRDMEIAFIHNSLLNDPFDPFFDLITEFNSYAELREQINKNYNKKEAAKFLSQCDRNTFAKLKHNWNAYTKKLRKNIFIFSCCTENEKLSLLPENNLYMWAHYANGHRGVAIEFNSELLIEEAREQGNIAVDYPGWDQIIYRDELSSITSGHWYDCIIKEDDSSLFQVIGNNTRTKSKVWEFENEWRLWWRNDEGNNSKKVKKIKIPNDAISKIYFGHLTDEKVKKLIKNNAKFNFPNAKIIQKKKKKGELALESV
ncbi:MAG: DUF2971 domain-containing protein, partial [Pseudomonadota bacterium]